MTMRLAAVLLCLAAPAHAEVNISRVDACVAQSSAQKRPPTDCIDAALAECLAVPADTPAVAGLCFSDAKEAFSAAISDGMQTLRASAPDQIAAIAGIEVKYDLLANLLQCDRMEDLAKLGPAPAQEIGLQKMRCEATAAGLTYMRLVWRARTLP
ncbi:hypothetical protein RGUI_3932 [Rhodovulum sp. P5]|uniref:hypothetical protein n=1 Tax=Rhodovulum sp. P5 TaxID=1564506 RepID=UPI0009C1F827|nr:hypothetical protein [Rhodovulum sp. P5]ARE42073.1 hypothetical protein RGUI_3932 [Rhodovulum sp. P5]